jgi:hypothetical protein
VYEEIKEQTLEMLMTDEFLRVDRNKHVIHVSKLFKIYAEDFGDTPEDVGLAQGETSEPSGLDCRMDCRHIAGRRNEEGANPSVLFG